MVQTQKKQITRKRYHPRAAFSAIHVTSTGLQSPFFFATPNFMMKCPPWEANRLSVSQEISRILWHPKIHYSIHKTPYPSLFWARSIQSMLPTHFLKIISVLSSHLGLGLPNCLVPSGFSTKTLYTTLLSPIRVTCPAHLILLEP